MIPARTRYKTYDQELLVIIEAFKIQRYYLKGYKYKVLVFTDYNNIYQFMKTKSLSFSHSRWAKKLSYYYFWIDYFEKNASRAADALSRFLQRSIDEKTVLRAENTQIFHYL